MLSPDCAPDQSQGRSGWASASDDSDVDEPPSAEIAAGAAQEATTQAASREVGRIIGLMIAGRTQLMTPSIAVEVTAVLLQLQLPKDELEHVLAVLSTVPAGVKWKCRGPDENHVLPARFHAYLHTCS